MPGAPDPARLAFFEQIRRLEERIRALETQQQFVITDPTGGTGDTHHGNAVAVIGNLTPITNLTSISTGLPLFGIASYKTGSWNQI